MRLIALALALTISLPTVALAATTPVERPSLDNNPTAVQVTKELPFPAAVVWNAMAADYGKIADSHPKIVRSDYRHGSLVGELGAERTCWFNDKGSRVLHEQIISWDPQAMTFENRILEASGFPVDPDNTLARVTVESLGEGRSRVTYDMQLKMKPGFMTGMMKGSFANLIEDYLIALDHHLATGEKVNKDNFKQIARAAK